MEALPPQKRARTTTAHKPFNSRASNSDDLLELDNYYIIPDSPALPNRRYETQATQIVDRVASISSSPTSVNEVQVPASSPFTGKETHGAKSTQNAGSRPPNNGTKRPLQMMMAPAGTVFRPPHGIVQKPASLHDDGEDESAVKSPFDNTKNISRPAPKTPSKAPPKSVNQNGAEVLVIDSDSSEDELSCHADIQPSLFKTKTGQSSSFSRPAHGNSKFQSIISNATYKVSEKRMASSSSHHGSQSSGWMTPGNGSVSKPSTQTKPERAAPVEDINIENEHPELRARIERLRRAFPMHTNLYFKNILLQTSGNMDEAARLIASGPTQGLSIRKPEQPQMKLTLDAPVASLIDKYSSTQAQSTTKAETPKLKKKKLVQGRRNPSSPALPISPVKSKSSPIIDLEDYDSDSAVASDYENDPAIEIQALKFLNECNVEALVELTNCTKENAKFMVDARPFESLEAAEVVQNPTKTKGGQRSRRAAIGVKIVQDAVDMFTGFEAVESLVKKCEEIGKPLFQEMRAWGVDASGAASGGELDIMSFEELNAPQRDSGIGSPNSGATSMNDDGNDEGDDEVKGNARRRAPNFIKQPSTMATDIVLKDYQLVGLNWLSMMYRQKLSGILADEMGLGKTAQVIALLSHLVETGNSGPHLVFCPASTLENWCKEIKRFSPDLTMSIYHGRQTEREQVANLVLQHRSEFNVVLTTYDMAIGQEDNKFMRMLKPDVCIYDEGHVLKNVKSKRYKQLMRVPARFKLLLTGTPLQNNLTELASLLAFILPGVFQEKQDDLDVIFKTKTTTRDTDHGALLSAQRITRARSMLTPFVLRRKKCQVLNDLPAKISRVEFCSLHPAQARIYEGLVDLAKERARLRLECGKTPKTENDENNPLMQLRKAAIHPLLFRRHFTDGKIEQMVDILYGSDPDQFPASRKREHLVKEMQKLSDFYLHLWCVQYPLISAFDIPGCPWMDSGKVEAAINLVKSYKKNGDRVLIFSQFVLVLDILEAVLNTSLISYARLDGSTPTAERQTLIDIFSDDKSITAYLLSTKAGGLGLNLVAANKVIIFDGSFNPHDDRQAEDRAWRIGQTRDVEVVRLVTRDTIEEQIYALGLSKLALDGKVNGDEIGQQTVGRMLLEGVKLSEEDTKTTIEGVVGAFKDQKPAEASPKINKQRPQENGPSIVEQIKASMFANANGGQRIAETDRLEVAEDESVGEMDGAGDGDL